MLRQWWIYAVAAVVLVLIIFTVFSRSGTGDVETSLGQFIEHARAGRVSEVTVDRNGGSFTYKLEGGTTTYATRKEEADFVRELLLSAGLTPEQVSAVQIETKDASTGGEILGLVLAFLPILLIVAVLAFLVQRVTARRRSSRADPVCQRKVSRKRAAGASTFQDITYYFCSNDCKQEFDRDPVSYLLKS